MYPPPIYLLGVDWNNFTFYSALHWLRIFENRVLRKILGLKTEKVTGGWRKLNKYELYFESVYARYWTIMKVKFFVVVLPHEFYLTKT
jgi:hypothetical protein